MSHPTTAVSEWTQSIRPGTQLSHHFPASSSGRQGLAAIEDTWPSGQIQAPALGESNGSAIAAVAIAISQTATVAKCISFTILLGGYYPAGASSCLVAAAFPEADWLHIRIEGARYGR